MFLNKLNILILHHKSNFTLLAEIREWALNVPDDLRRLLGTIHKNGFEYYITRKVVCGTRNNLFEN